MPGRRHLFAFCLLLAPVLLLLWLGTAELNRLGERADVALQSQALNFLRLARQGMEGRVEPFLESVLEPQTLAVDRGPLGAAAWALQQRQPPARHLLVLDDSGELLFPQASPTRLGLVLAQLPPDAAPQLRDAEALLETGDHSAALAQFEAYLALEEELGDRVGQAGALFRRASILAGTPGRAQDGLEAFQEFLTLFDPKVASLPEPIVELPLLAELSVVELLADGPRAVALAEAIANSRYDYISDDLLAAVLRRLADRIDGDPNLHAAGQSALAKDAHRRSGRAFAREYGLVARETMRRRLRASPEATVVHQVIVNQEGATSLLALRRATDAEEQLHGPSGWVGVHVDLALLLYDEMSPFLHPADHGFSLQVTDPDGIPILSTAAIPDTGSDITAQETAFGMVLRAVPVDPGRIRADRAADVRNQLGLLVALGLLTLAGAFLLWRSMRREAEVAQLKVDFVSRVSHELKTPLALVRMYGETLARGRAKTAAQQQKFASIITRESERLTALIDRILDFSRQEAGTLVYDPADVDLGALTAAVTDAYRPHVEARGLSLEVTVAPDLHVRVDRNALESALVNLMENAIKYTPDPSPEKPVEICVEPRGEGAIVQVRDRGVGIPQGDRERVFDSFFRASNAGEVRGAGLGLSLVRHFAHAHKGSVRAQARAGGGTTIELELPRKPSGAPDPSSTP